MYIIHRYKVFEYYVLFFILIFGDNLTILFDLEKSKEFFFNFFTVTQHISTSWSRYGK